MSHKLPVPSKKELETCYVKIKSISKVAKHFGTSNPTVRKWLLSYDIPRYTQEEAQNYQNELRIKPLPSSEEFEPLYRELTIEQIKEHYSIGNSTVYEWIEAHNLRRNCLGEKIQKAKKKTFDSRFGHLTKEQIEKDYRNAGCLGVLQERYSCSGGTLRKLFLYHEIETINPKTSRGQEEIASFIETELGLTVIRNDRKLIYPLEIDIYIPEKNIAIEYCGVYYHSETFGSKSKKYHINKLNLCTDKNVSLITVFESEWKKKKDILKSIISHKLGFTKTKIMARKTTVKQIEYNIVKNFEEENHIQGTRPAGIYFGLFDEKDELVMTMSFGKSRFNKNHKYEMIRMTTKKNTVITGGASKLFKYSGIASCITYSDRRFGEGKIYETIGFTKIKPSSPGYQYFHKKDHDTLYSRVKFQKHKIPNYEKSITEYENMLSLGYDRIWDCGNNVYVYINTLKGVSNDNNTYRKNTRQS
jgi:transposase